MKGLTLQIFYGSVGQVQRDFNRWVKENPHISVKIIKALIDPNPSPHYTGDLILLVFH